MIIRKADEVLSKPVEIDDCKDVQIRMLLGDEDGHTPRHSHAWEHECYILSGEGKVLTPDGEVDIASGDCLLIPCCDIHQFRNTGSCDMKFLCLVPKTDAQANDTSCCAGPGTEADDCCGE